MPRQRVPLAPLTTLGVGGPARFLIEARTEAEVRAALGWARRHGAPLRVLGGGSNVVIADEGVDGLVVRVTLRGFAVGEADGAVELTAAAGEDWDDLVAVAVGRGWAGLECLSGIPGLVGATPIQNVGAYGQDVSETVTAVRALDTRDDRVATLTPAECGFGYRDSVFKSREPGRYIILSVTYRLRPGGAPTVRYADVQHHLDRHGLRRPSLAEVRQSVLDIRRSKSMVLDDPADENRRSCGSFFTNPVIEPGRARAVEQLVPAEAVPQWPAGDGLVKLSAAWLIEHAGFRRGHGQGPVGLSTRHSLAIVAREGARARDVVDFARRLQAAVQARFGIRLTPEPVFWGTAL